MATLVIPIQPGIPSFRQRTTLDGKQYGLHFRWSMREERWYLDLYDHNDVLVVGSIKLVVNYPLLRAFRGRSGVPPGSLGAYDPRSSPADPGLDELGDIVLLLYLEAADLVGDSETAAAVGGFTPPPLGEL